MTGQGPRATKPDQSRVSHLDAIRSHTGNLIAGDAGSRSYEFALDLGFVLTVAESVLRGARERTESRGAHLRTDYPDTDADDAIELPLSAPLFPADSPSISSTPDDAASLAILIAAADGVPADGLDALAVDNDLTGPAIQGAAVPAEPPDTVRIVLDEPIELVGGADETNLLNAFELEADTEADAAIESIRVVDKVVKISLRVGITATDGDDGTIEDTLSFEQTAIGAPLRGATTGVAVADFIGLALRNEVAIEDPDVPPFGPDPDPGSGGSGSGGGVVTEPSDSVSQGTVEIVSDVAPASPGTTFRVEPTYLMELRFAAFENGTGILGVDELRGLSPTDPALGNRPFVTAFEIDIPEGLET